MLPGRWVLASSLLAACAGQPGGTIGGDDDDSPSECEQSVTPGPSPIRRLTRFEYDNTVRDLLSDDTHPALGFPPEEQALGFNNNAAALGVTQLLAEQYLTAAEGIAARATAPERLLPLLGCDPGQIGEDACVAGFIERFGRRAWRRPLTSDEIDALMALYTRVREPYDLPTGVQSVLQAMLQSPHFLYRVEMSVPDGVATTVVPLSSHELAARLSYLLWGSMPDDVLLAAADAGELSTPAQLEAQARRMLEDPRARAQLRNFHDQWLRLEWIQYAGKDPAIFPDFTPEVQAALREETLAFVDDVIWSGDGTLSAMLTAPYTMMNGTLAAFYGIPGGGDEFVRVDLNPTRYAGVLTQGGILAAFSKPNQTSPVLRGKFVREQLLCQQLPLPPPDVDTTPPDLDPDLTTRERFAEHSTNPVCAGCHHLMDPIGFGFEHFDGAGRWRADENGLAIDASGEILDGGDASGTFDGVTDLAARLAASEDVSACMATQWFRFAYGRVETDDDACSREQLAADFVASGGDIKSLLVALTQTEAFRYRTVVAPDEGGP